MSAQLDTEFRDFMYGRWPAMVRLAYALTGDQGHAEDVAQAAFARAYASWPKVRRTENPEGYVRRIVINENRNRFRKQRVAERLTGTPPEPGPGTGITDATSQYDERSALIASGVVSGRAWSVTAYLGPWGICVDSSTGGGYCTTTASGLGTSLLFRARGTPGVAGGTASAAVTRVVA